MNIKQNKLIVLKALIFAEFGMIMPLEQKSK